MSGDDCHPSLADGFRVAELWRRLLAGLIDAAVGVALLAGAGFAMFKFLRQLQPVAEPVRKRFVAWSDGRELKGQAWPLSLRVRIAIAVGSLNLEVNRVNHRTLGARVMRIRRADARTGGPVSIRSALISNLAHRTIAAALAPLAVRATKRHTERMQTLQPELKQIQREHDDDMEARQEALQRFYTEHKVNPLASCLPTFVIGLIVPWVPALLSPLRQTIPHRLAGIIWIVEDDVPKT
jgi:60Kd inner membrane protein/RDD family